ncbi:MAG: restriction endonuclease subunit S, partial [Bacteroidetes bacterium]|nr:restriction endonuclease subunit S [Bacteroidota bacterium]
PFPVYSSQTKNKGLAGYYKDYLYVDAITWTTDGANAGDVNFRKGKFYCTNVCGVLINKKGYSNHCVAALINSVSRKHVSYVGNPKLMNGVMSKIRIPFPKIPEQQKIAACLSSLDEVITAESQKLEVLKDHKRGLLQNLLPVGKETIPKIRFKEFQNDEDWNEDTLANIASFRRGSFPQPYGLPKWYDDDNGMPFIQVFDVGEDFRLKPTTKRKISSLAAEQSVFIPIGTLIITIQGSIGRVAITQYDAYIDRTLLLFEEFYQEVDITFFAYTIFLLFEIEKQKAPGGIIKTITKEVLSSFVVKLPSIEEQQKIASCLTSLDEFISAQTEKIESLQLHKKGLLQGLFPNLNEVTE